MPLDSPPILPAPGALVLMLDLLPDVTVQEDEGSVWVEWRSGQWRHGVNVGSADEGPGLEALAWRDRTQH